MPRLKNCPKKKYSKDNEVPPSPAKITALVRDPCRPAREGHGGAMAEVVTIRQLFDRFRGVHDFTKESILYLPHEVVVYCASEIVYGVPSTVIVGLVQGRPSTEVVLDYYPLDGELE